MPASKVPIKPGQSRTVKVRDKDGNIRTLRIRIVRKKGKASGTK